MFKSVLSGDIDQIIQSAYKIMQCPVIITDTSYRKLTEICPPTPQGDPKWDAYLSDMDLSYESIRHIYQNNYIEQMKDHFEPIMMNTGYFEDSPRLTAPVILNNNLVGYVSMLSNVHDCSDCQKTAIQIIADAVSLYLQGHEKERYDRSSLRQTLAQKMIFGKIHDKKELQRWLRLADAEIEPPYTLIMISNKLVKESQLYHYMKISLSNADIPMYLCQQDDDIYVLLYRVRDRADSENYISKILERIRSFSFGMGVSETFDSLKQVDSFRKQAQVAFIIGEKLESRMTVHYYKALILPAILLFASTSLGRENCLHGALETLTCYDRENNTDYLKTLKSLLYNTGDHARTCEEMHIHRNTLNYRLNRLCEIAKIDLSDSRTVFHLYLSFMIVDLEQGGHVSR